VATRLGIAGQPSVSSFDTPASERSFLLLPTPCCSTAGRPFVNSFNTALARQFPASRCSRCYTKTISDANVRAAAGLQPLCTGRLELQACSAGAACCSTLGGLCFVPVYCWVTAVKALPPPMLATQTIAQSLGGKDGFSSASSINFALGVCLP